MNKGKYLDTKLQTPQTQVALAPRRDADGIRTSRIALLGPNLTRAITETKSICALNAVGKLQLLTISSTSATVHMPTVGVATFRRGTLQILYTLLAKRTPTVLPEAL